MKTIKSCLVLIRTIGLKTFVIKLIKKLLRLRQYIPMEDFDEIEKYFLNKSGLEIGGPSAFFNDKGFMPIYSKTKNIDGINYSTSTIWTGAINEAEGYKIDGKRFGKQYILDAVDLKPLENNTYDFVLSCNNIEHIANPIKAVEQWLSILKEGGLLVVVAPRKESNFDHNREIVKFEHLISDYEKKMYEDDLTHLEEILKYHDLAMDLPAGTIDQFKKRGLNNFENRCLHHHVFDLNVLKEIYDYFNLSIIKSIQINSDYVILGQKRGRTTIAT